MTYNIITSGNYKEVVTQINKQKDGLINDLRKMTFENVKWTWLISLMQYQNIFQMEKGVRQGCILSPYSFKFYAEYIMRNAWLDEAQTGIKMARRNINNLRYADNTTLGRK